MKIIKPLLSTLFFLISFNALASDASVISVIVEPIGDNRTGQAEVNQCESSVFASNACAQYIKGYLAALHRLNQNRISSAFSAWQERAYRTRLSITKQHNSVENQLGVCLPSSISDTEIQELQASLISKSSKNHALPIKDAVFKAIQDRYSC